MPLYEYECDACGQRFEAIQKFSDTPLEECRKCGKGPVRRLLSSPAIQFKGSGWYITDYAKKGSDSSSKPSSSSDSSKTDSAKTESKGESTTKSDASPKSDSATKTD